MYEGIKGEGIKGMVVPSFDRAAHPAATPDRGQMLTLCVAQGGITEGHRGQMLTLGVAQRHGAAIVGLQA